MKDIPGFFVQESSSLDRVPLPARETLLFVIPGGEVNRELWRDATTIETLPTVLLIDDEGSLHATLVGEQIDEKLSQTIQKLLATEPERP